MVNERGIANKAKDNALELAAKEKDMIAKFKIMFPGSTIVFGKHDADPIAKANEEVLAAKIIAKKEADDKKEAKAEAKAIADKIAAEGKAAKKAALEAEIAALDD